MIDLEATINACIKNDRNAQQEFFKHFYGRLSVVSRRISPNDNIANDILQDSFIRIFDKLHTLKNINEAVVYSWCKKIILNIATDFYREEKRFMTTVDVNGDIPEHWLYDDSDPTYGEEDDDDFDLGDIDPSEVIKAIQSLSPQYKLVFNMYVMENYSHDEIAKKLKISVGTSKSNLSKARANLKNKLKTIEA